MSSHHLERAHQLLELQRYEACYQEAAKSLQEDPLNEDAFFLMALSSIPQKKYAQAEELGKNALAHHPDSARLYYVMGMLFNTTQDFVKAKDYLEAAIGIDPEESIYFYELARTQLGFTQVDRAKKILDHCLSLHPNFDAALRLKSLLEQGTASPQNAHDYADQALKISPEEAYSHLIKGLICWQNGQFTEAASFIQTTVQLDPSNHEALAMWLEARARNQAPWKKVMHLLGGRRFGLSLPIMWLGAVTFIPSVLIANEKNPAPWLWLIFGLLLLPILIFWWGRPFIKMSFLSKKWNLNTLVTANASFPIEVLASLNILSSVIYWLGGSGLFFGIAFLSLVVAGSMAQFQNTEAQYPVYNTPWKTTGISVLIVLGVAVVAFILHQLE